ncbi:glycoside hydrolase family 3 N-terminal domain-containing protein, partial [Blautia hydrogenotrophica]
YGLSSEENGSTGFSKSPVSVYWEDIYTGYRYFDTFGKPVLYPFGYGLSYTEFAISDASAEKQNGGIMVTANVKNIGEISGKEVIQVYLSKVNPAEGVERPYQELKGFEKTADLAPGEKEKVKIWIPWRELAVYDEGRAAWVIESGDYLLKMGNSSRDTSLVGMVRLGDTVLTEQCANRMIILECNRDKLSFLTQKDYAGCHLEDRCEKKPDGGVTGMAVISVTEEDILAGGESRQAEKETQQNLPELSIEELASLCVGYGPGTPFAAVGDRSDPSAIFDGEGKPITTNNHPTGYPGYVSPAIEEKGIKSIFYKDGPAGIGGIAWPTEMLIACSFDRKLWQMFGDAVGKECEDQQVNVWLAPAVNLHRNPLCGRNFEYFSEDPYLTGVCACEITKGVQNGRPVIVCPKHFAANEQETFRRGNAGKKVDAVDSILTERSARELYLKPFEMLVREAHIACIMTSFNKINGVFAGGSKDLCTRILREEWGFDGAVVTDWGDMDIVVDGADAVAAGNDIVMPGGPPVIRQILKGYEEGRVTREEMETAAGHLLCMIRRIHGKEK